MKTINAFLTAVLLLLACLCGCGRLPAPAETTTAVPAAESTAPLAPDETRPMDTPSAVQEAKLYADYLANGGYDDILNNEEDHGSNYEAQACLADVNDDGVRELLMHITDKTMAGVRGFPSVTVLLGVRDGKVERLGFAEYGGGSGGGDYLFIKYDTQTGKHVLEYEEFVRDGMFFNTYALHYFDVSQTDSEKKQYGLAGSGDVVYKTTHTLRCDTYYTEGTYAEDAQRALDESDLCEQADGFVTAYLYDDDYISKTDYDALHARFIEPTDPAYQMKPVTLESPIPG